MNPAPAPRPPSSASRNRNDGRLNGLATVAGGTALALGVQPKLAALELIGSLIPTTIAGHAFWEEEDAGARRMQETQFLKNLGLIGGLLFLLALQRD